MFRKTAFIATALALVSGSVAVAEGEFDRVIETRQGLMGLFGHNLGVLGMMAQGRMAYDPEAAVVAASNLVHLSSINTSSLWPEGSDLMGADNTRALPDLWDNLPDVMMKVQAVNAAAINMEAAAGDGLESLQAAMGDLGGACTACHRAYRQPE